jgi:hypothetical protein
VTLKEKTPSHSDSETGPADNDSMKPAVSIAKTIGYFFPAGLLACGSSYWPPFPSNSIEQWFARRWSPLTVARPQRIFTVFPIISIYEHRKESLNPKINMLNKIKRPVYPGTENLIIVNASELRSSIMQLGRTYLSGNMEE